MNSLKIIYLILLIIGGALFGFGLVNNQNLVLIIIGVVLIIAGIILDIVDSKYIKHNDVKKNRTTLYVQFDCDKKIIEDIISKIFIDNKYELAKYGQEEVYKNGRGILTAQKMLKIDVQNSKVVLECWISLGLDNNPNMELPLDKKFLGSFPKRQLKKVVDNIIQQIEQTKDKSNDTNSN